MKELNLHDESIRRLAEGYKVEFTEEVAGDERFHDLLMDLADEFVNKNIPIVSADDVTDLAYELIMRVTTKVV